MLRILFLILIILSSCKRENKSDYVSFSGKIVYNTDLDTVSLKTHRRYYLNSQAKINQEIALDQNGEFTEELSIPVGYYELNIADRSISLFLQQDYSLHIQIDSSDVSISGQGAVENLYLQDRIDLEHKLFPINFYQHYSNLGENEFLKLADSIKTIKTDLINLHRLDDEHFRFLEESYASIERELKLISYPWHRKNVDKEYVPSKAYPDPYKYLDINDRRLTEIPLFSALLFEEFNIKNLKSNNSSFDRWLNTLRLAITDTTMIRNSNVREHIAFTITKFNLEHTDSLDLFYQTFKDFTRNERDLAEITSKYNSLKGFSKGSIPPDFEFYDINDEIVSTESLMGNIVFLDIWATWCKPCINEIESSNILQAKFANDSIKFVSICIRSNKDNWLRIIQEKEFKGIHVFCPKEMELEFDTNYLIESLPRYIIIDENGLVHDFNSYKPSDPRTVIELEKLFNRTYANSVHSP